jgi:glyoxylase-like metal-dependent hydrolase (beta-lactamase superfamily II)
MFRMLELARYKHDIYAFDSGCFRPMCAAVHLIVEKGRVAFVETANNASLPRALEALQQLGLGPEAVDWVVVTHVHLDHAGGAGSYLQAFPNAKLVVHPRGARHMADPSKLWAGTVAVYGEEVARNMYGELLPIPVERIVEGSDKKVIDLAGRELICLDTPGHARHHLCLLDTRSGCLFTGDVFGLSYRELDVDGRPSIIPTTTPVQFEPEEMRRSIDLILSYQPSALYLTHFSEVREVARLGADLHRLLDGYLAIAERVKDAGEARYQLLLDGLYALMDEESQRQGWRLPRQEIRELLRLDLELNAQGLVVWLDGRA